MIDTEEMTDAALAEIADRHASAARAEQARAAEAAEELARREAVRAAELADRQRAWDGDLVRRHKALEEHLRDVGQAASAQIDADVAALDMNAAVASWITSRATRTATQTIRDAARMAETNAQTGLPVSDVVVRWYDPDLLTRLQAAADKAATVLGQETAERWLADRPTDLGDGA